MMRVERLSLDGPLLLVPEVHGDARGFFVETFRDEEAQAAGIRETFVQHNQSRSVRGTVRGLHFQVPPGQAKIIRVARGAIQDVIVDIRAESPTFGQHSTLRLDDVDHHQLYVPRGFAHGFCVLSDEADVVYGVSDYFRPELDRGLAWDDPDLGIAWPVERPILSDRDRRHPRLAELDSSLTRW